MGLLLLLLLACSGCSNRPPGHEEKLVVESRHLFDAQDFASGMRQMLAADKHNNTISDTAISAALQRVYAGRDFQPVWLSESGVLARTAQLVTELYDLSADGLNPETYHTDWLKTQLENAKTVREKEGLQYALDFDFRCSYAYLLASRQLLLGSIPARRADSLWFAENDSLWQAPDFLGHPDASYVSLDSFRSKFPGYVSLRNSFKRLFDLRKDNRFMALRQMGTDSATSLFIHGLMPQLAATDSLSQQLRAFQYWRGLKVSGQLDSSTRMALAHEPDMLLELLAINMERIRWLPQCGASRAILVDIPAMELFFLDQQNMTQHMRTVVGKRSRQTPSLNAAMRQVVFNPSWGVPPTILKKDVKSGLGRSGGSYLAKKGLRAYTHSGREVSASQVTAANAGNFVFRQPPGPRNALGLVKFDLPNKWDIYLHDTPHRSDFSRKDRALSSGCIRLQHPRDLAAYILNDLEGKSYDLSRIDSITTTRKTKYQKLDEPIMVYVVYLTAFPDSNFQELRFLPDIYGKDAKLKTLYAQQHHEKTSTVLAAAGDH